VFYSSSLAAFILIISGKIRLFALLHLAANELEVVRSTANTGSIVKSISVDFCFILEFISYN
jgi:hypothetical protein